MTPSNMKAAIGAILSLSAAYAALADIQDITISESGTHVFDAGVSYGSILNEASGAVTLASSGGATEADAVSVTNFDAVADASTTFSGGWWNFGVLPSDATYPRNFFTTPASIGGRTTVLDSGAVITNVGCVSLAGASGTDNTLELKGGARMVVREMMFGKAQGPQRSKCIISGGAGLHCLGVLSMSEGSARDVETNKTGNVLAASGEGSSVIVDGETYLGRSLGSSNGGLGGNTLAVSNNATANFKGGIVVCSAVYHGSQNHIVFSDGARVNMTSFKSDADWASVHKPSSNAVEILSGAVVTNTGAFTFGYSEDPEKSHAGDSVVISNATFVTKAGTYGSSTGFITAPHMTVRLSGPDAKLEFTGGFPKYFFGKPPCGTFIVENGASFNYALEAFTYNAAGKSRGHKFIVRTGAKVTVENGFKPCTSDYYGSNNLIRVESGGNIIGNGVIAIAGSRNAMEVVNGAVSMKYYLYVGHNNSAAGSGTNCLLHIEGTHPSIRPARSSYIRNASKVRIALPAAGYDDGYAVSTNAVVAVHEGSMTLAFNDTSTLELTGAEAMLDYHREHRKKADYYLLSDTTTTNKILSDEKIEAIQATLPQGMTLSRKTEPNHEYIVLSVRPKWGTIVIVN